MWFLREPTTLHEQSKYSGNSYDYDEELATERAKKSLNK